MSSFNTKIKLKVLFLIFVFFLPEVIYSQIGSTYSRFGLGDVVINPSIRRNGFGSLGTALIDQFDINSYNPAAWSGIIATKMSASMRFNGNNFTDGINSNYLSNASFESLNLAIPISPINGITAVLGVTPLTKVSYDISGKNIVDSIEYTEEYSGDGGLNKVFLGTSYRFPFGLSVGISFNSFFGTINNKSVVKFNSNEYLSTAFVNESKYRGFNLSLGLVTQNLNNLLNLETLDELHFGLVFSTKASLSTELNEIKFGTIVDTMISKSFDTEVPAQLGIGFSARFSKRLNLFVDYFRQDWTQFRSSGLADQSLKALSKYAMGLEYLPTSKPENFFQAFIWRFGIFYKDSEYSYKNNRINEIGANFGFSFPIDANNSMDFAIEYSIRGTTSQNLQKDNFIKIWAGINFAELWFIRDED